MTWRFIGLLALFVTFYAVMVMNLATMRSSDIANSRMAAAFAVISGVGVWIVLLLLMEMPHKEMWLGVPIFVLMALTVAPIVSLVDGALGRRRYVATFLPLPFLAIAVWMRFA